MADNFVTNPGTGGSTYAANDVGGVLYPRVKLTHGEPGTAVDASATDPLPVTLPGLAQLEDSPHVSAAAGIMALAVRQDADGALAGDGDYTPLQTNAVGRLKASVEPAMYPLVTGSITANAQTVFALCDRASNIMVFMVATSLVGHNATFEGSLNSTNGTDGNWFAIQAVRSNANTIETTTGVLAATPVYAWELSVNGLTYFRVRATAHTSGTAAYQILRGAYATEPIPAAQISGTQPVSGTVTANIGTGALAAGTNAIGDVGLQGRANATGAHSIAKVLTAATTNATLVKATAGRVFGWHFTNTSAAVRVVRLHNLTVAPTVGTSVPAYNIVIPAGGHVTASFPVGIAHATGISYSVTAGLPDLDATATAANDVIGAIHWL